MTEAAPPRRGAPEPRRKRRAGDRGVRWRRRPGRGEVGAGVAVHYRCDADGAAAVVDAMGAAGSRAIAACAELLDRAALLSEPTRFQRYGIGSPMLNDCCRATRPPATRVCGNVLERAVQTRSEASCSDSRSAIMIVGMWTNPEGTSDIRLMSDYVSTTRRSSYTGTGRLKPFISSCTAGCASTESSKAENARWLRRICPAAAASLSLAARLVTGPSTP